MCNVLEENAYDSVEAYMASKPVGVNLRKNLLPVESICQDICQILSPVQQSSCVGDGSALHKLDVNHVDEADMATEMPISGEAQTRKNGSTNDGLASMDGASNDVLMEEAKPAADSGTVGTSRSTEKAEVKYGH